MKTELEKFYKIVAEGYADLIHELEKDRVIYGDSYIHFSKRKIEILTKEEWMKMKK